LYGFSRKRNNHGANTTLNLTADAFLYGLLNTLEPRMYNVVTYHPYEQIASDELIGVFETVFVYAVTIEEAVSSLNSTGISPLKQDIFTEDGPPPPPDDL
jgi:hypothetical protein